MSGVSPAQAATRVPLLLAYGVLVASQILPLFFTIHLVAQMLVVTVTILYIGSHASVPWTNKKVVTKKDGKLHVMLAAGKDQQNPEIMTTQDVMKFPLVASCVLFSLYLVFKFVPQQYVKYVVKTYFSILGTISLFQVLSHFASLVSEPDAQAKVLVEFDLDKVPLVGRLFIEETGKSGPEASMVRLTARDLPLIVICLACAAWYATQGHWIANNIFGIAFSIQGIQLVPIAQFQHAALLLGGLFFYDIFWVFGTDVMVTVAKSFDGPIKLLFHTGLSRPSMLGLGDIVMPGILVALMLRFDYNRIDLLPVAEAKSSGWLGRKAYFWTVLAGYVAGLGTTIWVMFTFDHAQPALLYLVPTTLLAVLLLALVKRQVKMLVFYNEEYEEQQEKTPAQSKKDE